ncbi:probable polygalacturonase isoform X2 [Durio zibethinus]|uniref:Probable polygalacturonase isoform X2 n=1 Tax=Durio zibethinus TaxID=66656 RepID=A0A6P6BCA1_DURZI|nr:probable polygalacturonase isoform X2 [Durio zibethinus]
MESEKPNFGAVMVYFKKPSWAFLVLLFTVIAVLSLQITTKAIIPFQLFPVLRSSNPDVASGFDPGSCAGFLGELPERKHVMSIKDFGAIGDGKTSNTAAFRKALVYMQRFGEKGGAQLNVPKGKWLTGSFNLTSNFTLFLEQGAVILGSQDPEEWPVVEPLPSYGRGRERLGGRHISLIHGDGLINVVITDSSTNVCIEDCYIESGDDLVAVKSGWDQYGIRMARPSSNIIVRRISGTTPTCSGVGIGSEMSGGIFNVTIEDMHVWNSAAGVRIKTDTGRGGYIANITINNITMERVKIPIRVSRGSNDHPDDGWDPKAIPKIKGIVISNIVSLNSTKAPVLAGVQGASFEGICFKNVTLLGLAPTAAWHCEFVSGCTSAVFPLPCPQLQNNGSSACCL